MRNDQVPCKAHNRLGCLLCWERTDGNAPPAPSDLPRPGGDRPGTLGVSPRIEYNYNVSGNTVYGRPGSARPRYQHHNDDTAPFDVEALLALLHGGGTEAAANHYGGDQDYSRWNGPFFYDRNVTTHYYGDECPGGHQYDTAHYEHLDGPDDDDDTNYWANHNDD